MVMKCLPSQPYIENLRTYYLRNVGPIFGAGNTSIIKYQEWLKQYGFEVPVRGTFLIFPDDFDDNELLLFILRWS